VSPEKPSLTWGFVSAAVLPALIGVTINLATDRNNFIAWVAVILATVVTGMVNIVVGQFAVLASSTRWRMGVAAAIGAVATVVLVWIVLSTESVDADARSGGQAGKVIREADSYSLVSADEVIFSNFCPKGDKLDLDSGRPGYGGQTQLGDYLERCRTEGGLAELILERSELHTPDNSRLYRVMRDGRASSYDDCQKSLADPSELRAKLSLRELAVGAGICVRTDEGNIAFMRIREIGTVEGGIESELVIDFVTWQA
jgi:hypothetical protein